MPVLGRAGVIDSLGIPIHHQCGALSENSARSSCSPGGCERVPCLRQEANMMRKGSLGAFVLAWAALAVLEVGCSQSSLGQDSGIGGGSGGTIGSGGMPGFGGVTGRGGSADGRIERHNRTHGLRWRWRGR